MAHDPPALIAAWQRGDEAATRAVFEQYYPPAVRVATLSGLSVDAAEDCAQNAFVRAYERRRQLRDPAAFPLWFHRLLSREILGCTQRQATHATRSLDREDVGEDWQRRQPPQPDEVVIAAEDRERLWLQIQALAPRARVLLVLRYYQDFTVHDIAAICETSENVVRVALHRALNHLRALAETAADAPQPDHSAMTPAGEPLASHKE